MTEPVIEDNTYVLIIVIYIYRYINVYIYLCVCLITNVLTTAISKLAL